MTEGDVAVGEGDGGGWTVVGDVVVSGNNG